MHLHMKLVLAQIKYALKHILFKLSKRNFCSTTISFYRSVIAQINLITKGAIAHINLIIKSAIARSKVADAIALPTALNDKI